MKKYLKYVLILGAVLLLTALAAYRTMGHGYLAYPAFVLGIAVFIALDRYAGADWTGTLYFASCTC